MDEIQSSSDAPPPAKKVKKVPKILDGTFYTIESNNDGKIIAKCVECGEIKKGEIGSSGNFKSHYKTHKSQFNRLEEYLKPSVDNTQQEIHGKSVKQSDIRHLLAPVSDEKVYFDFVPGDCINFGTLSHFL